MPPPQERSWFGRNWIWVLPLGCLGPVLACGGCLAVFITAIFGVLKSSEPYQEALARARANDDVQAALGAPIEPAFFFAGNIETKNVNGVDSGKADMAIPISGPKGSGTIRLAATRSAGKWVYSVLEVAIAG